MENGYRSGSLTFIKETECGYLPCGQKRRYAIANCDCGVTKKVGYYALKYGRIRSCGCLSKPLNGESATKLGRAYRSMIRRCSPSYFQSIYYHDRGIAVCDEWIGSYENFKNWALENGFKNHLQLDRIDNDKGYSPNNCRFVDHVTNVNNRRNTKMVEYNGKMVALMPLLRKLNKEHCYGAIMARINRGWQEQRAIDSPIRVQHRAN